MRLLRPAAAAAFALTVALSGRLPARAAAHSIAFIPLDDRPVTLQLPAMLGAIAGQPVLTPPRAALGHYLTPGDPEAIIAWLQSSAVKDASAMVASLDMIGYGGLVASRVPGQPDYVAYYRLRQLAAIRSMLPGAFIGAFGTIMRLAPTGVPRLPETARYWATGDTVELIAQFANLPVPPQTEEQRAYAAGLRQRIGPATLDAYLGARRRNRDVDEFALQLAAEGGFDRIVLGQDDAGPSGLHLADLAALNAAARRFGLGEHASIEPGADELGMVLLGSVFARNVGWTPRVRVRYSHPGAERVVDHLEYVPIDVTIGKLIAASGALRVETEDADIDLFVRVNGERADDEQAFVDAIAADVAAHRSVAVADLTFLRGEAPSAEQQSLVRALIDRGIAGKIDAFASWNTNANTVGTALATALAVGAGRRAGAYDPRAHAQFMLDRYADDYAFHQFVRPVMNEDLRAAGTDPTLLVSPVLRQADDRNRALLWPQTLALLAAIYPQYRDAGLTITLPWQRTFETMLDVRLKSKEPNGT
jgi:hypothetical protein